MKVLNPRNNHLRIWFPDRESLRKFKDEYTDSVENVSILVQDFTYNGEKGHVLIINLTKKLDN